MSASQPLSAPNVVNQAIQQEHSSFRVFGANAAGAVVHTAALATLAPWGLCLAKFAYTWGSGPVGILALVAARQGLASYGRGDDSKAALNKAAAVPATAWKWTKTSCNWAKTQGTTALKSGWQWAMTQYNSKMNPPNAQPDAAPVVAQLPLEQPVVQDLREPEVEPDTHLEYLKNKSSEAWTSLKQGVIDTEKGLFRLTENFGANRKAILFGAGVGALHMFYEYATVVTPLNQPTLPISPLNSFTNLVASYYSYQIAGAVAGVTGLILGSKTDVPAAIADVSSAREEAKIDENRQGSSSASAVHVERELPSAASELHRSPPLSATSTTTLEQS